MGKFSSVLLATRPQIRTPLVSSEACRMRRMPETRTSARSAPSPRIPVSHMLSSHLASKTDVEMFLNVRHCAFSVLRGNFHVAFCAMGWLSQTSLLRSYRVSPSPCRACTWSFARRQQSLCSLVCLLSVSPEVHPAEPTPGQFDAHRDTSSQTSD